jgi:hypothetical protein
MRDTHLLVRNRFGRVFAASWLVTVLFALIWGFTGCQKADPGAFRAAPSSEFFPLTRQSHWTYDIDDKSQAHPFTIVDTVIGRRYISSLNLMGTVVEEYCTLEGADEKTPIMFVDRGDYLARVSALVYSQQDITAGPFGVVKENKFLPRRLTDEENWTDEFWPLGQLAAQPVQAFKVALNAYVYGETTTIEVPAGKFRQCIRIESILSYSGGPYEGRAEQLSVTDWYAPRVGLIQSLVRGNNINGPIISRRVLREYGINNDVSTNG